jgi:hypothetical protein
MQRARLVRARALFCIVILESFRGLRKCIDPNENSPRRRRDRRTLLTKKYSELRKLSASVVNLPFYFWIVFKLESKLQPAS